MKTLKKPGILCFLLLCCCSVIGQQHSNSFSDAKIGAVVIQDQFWQPRLKQWSTVTINDVFDKFEGKHKQGAEEQAKNNALNNFKLVADGKLVSGRHVGFPWFDGLVYETIRGASDYLKNYPDEQLEKRIDVYIDNIYAAQVTDASGYLNTYTQLVEPGHEWGNNGGFLRWQHDVYNAGMLVEAGVHYYRATGKTKLLEAAVKIANLMCTGMGPSPKKNMVPAHSGPEEAMMKLYWLFKNNAALKNKLPVVVQPNNYYELAKFWIENRGHHSGYPLWAKWGNDASEKWIRDPQNQSQLINSRPTWGSYAQDSVPVFEQQTIEGHAVRATLLATGMAAVAQENHSPKYMQTLHRLWGNMVGKRMFITGGVGAIHYDEKFGADYFLPPDAYLETCAAVGSGFFHKKMFELTHDGKYMDELERILYNSLLTGISLSGNKYTYQNPLNAHNHKRWDWHECPCCPPMFLKITSEIPGYIYATDKDKLYVNLFIGSSANIQLGDGNIVAIKQQTNYPWDGKIVLNIEPERKQEIPVYIRIPGWAGGIENPYQLYTSDLHKPISLLINGKQVKINKVNGYAVISRKWKKGDKITMELPVQPRIIKAHAAVKDLQHKLAIAAGPVVYCVEENDAFFKQLQLTVKPAMVQQYNKNILGGVNTIAVKNGNKTLCTAIPYYAVGNTGDKNAYNVWLPAVEKD